MPPPPINEIATKAARSTALPQDAAEAWRASPAAIARTTAALVATFVVGCAGGYAAKLLHFPLPYMTGALIITAALGLAGAPVRALWQARTAGQFVTGAAIGTAFTPAVLGHLLLLLPVLILMSAVSIVISGVGALMLMRLAHLDRKTAFLATLPGGVIEMANVATRLDADPLPVMVLQTMRVGITVCIAPFLAILIADDGLQHVVPVDAVMPWLDVAWLSAASLVCGLMLRLFNVVNCWFFGSIAAVALLGAFGVIEGHVPDAVLVAAQVIIGTSIGSRFQHAFLTRLSRLLLSSFVTVPYAIGAMALVGAVSALALGLPVATMFLAFAPAGIAEMALTGKVLGLDAALITGAQLTRILLVAAGASYACRMFERLTTPRT
jgi:uncharacterized protein